VTGASAVRVPGGDRERIGTDIVRRDLAVHPAPMAGTAGTQGGHDRQTAKDSTYMNSVELLTDAYGRIKEDVHGAVEGLAPPLLNTRIDPGANSISWLVWHLTRVQDDHVSEVAERPQAWTSQGWAGRFQLPFDDAATGYGHRSKEVGQVQVESGALLLGYYDAVHEQTMSFLRGLADADLDTVVDEAWTPPVTLGVRLVSVLDDDLQHAGQAAFVRGVLQRR
jgi:uncharacterized damage-inducible protein DinB